MADTLRQNLRALDGAVSVVRALIEGVDKASGACQEQTNLKRSVTRLRSQVEMMIREVRYLDELSELERLYREQARMAPDFVTPTEGKVVREKLFASLKEDSEDIAAIRPPARPAAAKAAAKIVNPTLSGLMEESNSWEELKALFEKRREEAKLVDDATVVLSPDRSNDATMLLGDRSNDATRMGPPMEADGTMLLADRSNDATLILRHNASA